MPIIHFIPSATTSVDVNDEMKYMCPLYKTSVRAGVLSTTGQSTNYILSVALPMKHGVHCDFWILRGTALLCMLD